MSMNALKNVVMTSLKSRRYLKESQNISEFMSIYIMMWI